jgi:hypothetical protein
MTECGVCKGQGRVLIVNPTAGPPQEIQTCTNCGGQGMVWVMGTFAITFKRSDELPPTVRKKCYTRIGTSDPSPAPVRSVARAQRRRTR